MKRMRYKLVLLLSLLSLPAMLLAATGGPAAAAPQRSAASARTAAVTSSNLGTFKPTFAGPAATGCSVNCSLLTGPVNTPSTAAAARANAANAQQSGKQDQAHAMPLPDPRRCQCLRGRTQPPGPYPLLPRPVGELPAARPRL